MKTAIPITKEPDFRKVFDSLQGMFLVFDPNLNIVAVSDGYCQASETERSKLLLCGINDVFPDDEKLNGSGIGMRTALKSVFQSRTVEETGIQAHNGYYPKAQVGISETRYWRAINSPILDEKGGVAYIVHWVEDVTEIVRLQESGAAAEIAKQLADQEKERAEDAKLLAEEEKARAQVAKGLAEEEKARAEVAKRLAEEEKARAEVAKRLAEEEKARAEVAKRLAEEEKARAEVAKRLAESERKIAIEEKRKAEVEKQEAAGAKRVADEEKKRADDEKRRADTANSELEAFSYSVAHDLRSPLRGIDGFSQLLLEGYEEKLDATGKDYLSRVRAGCQRMGHLIDDLLNLASISRCEIRSQSVNLSSLAIAVAKEMQSTDQNRSVELKIASGIMAMGDSGLLQVVMQNLVSNAWKFTGKKIDAVIEFGMTEINGKETYFIRDNGAGFDMTYADKLFGVFQRLHSKSDFAGTGIGLATVKRIINRHGGEIWGESSIGQGTVFYFYLGDLNGRSKGSLG